jgi:hypothetical protein
MLAALAGRRGIGGKLGLAALGFMAYRAYQDQRARQESTRQRRPR